VHISAMSKTFIKDPREVVKPGDIVKVKVLEVRSARQAHRADLAHGRPGRRQGRTARKPIAARGSTTGR